MNQSDQLAINGKYNIISQAFNQSECSLLILTSGNLKWCYDQIFTPWFFDLWHRIPCKNENVVYRLKISAIIPEIFQFENWAKYANEKTDDIIHSTQYYIEYVNWAILANLQCRTLTLSRLIVLQETQISIWKLCSHGNSLFSSSHPLDFNMLVIFSLKNVKQGHKLKLTHLYASWIMHMKCC